MNDIIVRVWNAPTTVKGVTTLDGNGDYNIYINANISSEEQVKAYFHEMQHIKKNHFELPSAHEAERDIV